MIEGYREVLRDLPQYAREHGLWIAVATQTGRTVDEDFPGGGYLFNPRGERVFATADWIPGEVYLEVDLEGGSAAPMQSSASAAAAGPRPGPSASQTRAE